MSASAPRARGGNPSRGSRGMSSTPSAARGSSRGRQAGAARGATRGARRGNAAPGHGLLQQLRSGTVARNGHDAGTSNDPGHAASGGTTTHGRGRDSLTRTFNQSSTDSSATPVRSLSPAPFSSFDATNVSGDISQRYAQLKDLRDAERKEAIRMGFLADPQKKTTLAQAITPVGTCVEMCPQFERVERMVQMMVDGSEKTSRERDAPASEKIMVKRFRRSAAGDDEQIPSDIRTPETLRRTLNYLIDELVGGPERLAVVHKFVWDRTRAIRNDFSIQQVSKDEDVKIAVECFERIARFHILALHQLSNPDNLRENENFDVYQDREQLANTLLSLSHFYDDYRHQVSFPNEAEFRAYHMIMAITGHNFDMEDRIQSWPAYLIADARVQTALRLYQASGDTLFHHGPLRPFAPISVARNNSANFWTIMNSGAVSYLLACVAEIFFNQVRFVALSGLLRSAKSASQGLQQKSRDWTLEVVTEYLGFDVGAQTIDFCAVFDLAFATDDQNVTYLDVASHAGSTLDQSSLPTQYDFSYTFVEEKRCRRTFPAIINNSSVAEAIRQGMVKEADTANQDVEEEDNGQGMFFPEPKSETKKAAFGSGLFNPQASSFTPSSPFGTSTPTASSPFAPTSSASTTPAFSLTKKFGESADPDAPNPFSKQQGFGGFGGGPGSTQGSILKFGQVDATKSMFGTQNNTSTIFGPAAPTQQAVAVSPDPPNYMTQFGTPRPSTEENSPFGKPAATAEGTAAATQPAVPNFISQFGTARPSNTENNPFGKSSQPDPVFGLGANATQSLSDQGNPFNKAATQAAQSTLFPPATQTQDPVVQAATSAPAFHFNFATATTTETSAATSPFTFTDSTSKPNFSVFPTATQITVQPQSPETTTPTQPSFALPKTTFEFPKAQPFQPSGHPSPSEPAAAIPPQIASAGDVSIPLTSEASKPAFTFSPTKVQATASSPPSQSPPFSIQPRPEAGPLASVSSVNSLHKQFDCQIPGKPFSLKTNSAPDFTTALPPSQEKESTPDKAQLTDRFVRIALTQPRGLIQQYLEYNLPDILRAALKDHQEEQFRQTLARVKSNYLQRKYGGIWRNIAWQKSLQKRASKRRQIFAESVRINAARKRRSEQELKDILDAAEDKKRIQAEIHERQKAEAIKATRENPKPTQLAGSKRKSVGEYTAVPSPQASSRVSKHKRSRTMGAMLPPPTPGRSNPSAPSFRHSIFSGRTSLNRSVSGSNLRASAASGRQDETKTDYFRLKANGIDPDTPLVPLSTRQVEARRRKDREDREQAIARAYDRRRVSMGASQYRQSAPSVATSPSAAAAPSLPVSASSGSPVAASTYDPATDLMLQQLREARLNMQENTSWLKEQNEEMKKELKEEEKLRLSAGSASNKPILNNRLSVIEGHAYDPVPPPMSRVERRIREFGGLGLAYKPVGQTSRSASRTGSIGYGRNDYDEKEEVAANGTARKRQRRGDVDRSYRPSKQELDSDEEDLDMVSSPQKRPKKQGPPIARKTFSGAQPLQYIQPAMNQEGDTEEEELYEDDDAEDDMEDYYNRGPQQYHNGKQPVYYDGDEEEEELYDEDDSAPLQDHAADAAEYEEDEEYDSDEDADAGLDPNGVVPGYAYASALQRQSPMFYEEAPTPNTQATSRATSSGPGATADDALVLSDSD